MLNVSSLLLVIGFSFAFSKENLKTHFVEVPIDHFDLSNLKSFQLRYLVYDHHHIKGGPILLFIGNEGNINMFVENTGFMFETAPVLNALIVFAEHRYYGQSLPFGNSSFSSPDHLKFLTTSQVLRDFVVLVEELKKNYMKGMISRDTYPIVAIGGSYGGILAAWLRMKYPHTVIGAIASSAPILFFEDLTPCDQFYTIVTKLFEKFGTDECTDAIRKSWPFIRNLTKSDKGKFFIHTSINYYDRFINCLNALLTN